MAGTGITTSSDLSYRQQAQIVQKLLAETYRLEVFGKYATGQTLKARNTMTMKWKGYDKLPIIKTAAVEGVTPTSQKLTSRDVSLTLKQLISVQELTDVMDDTHEDDIFNVQTERGAKQMAQSIEFDSFATLKACSNVFYANGAAVTDVNTVLTATIQKKVLRALKRQDTGLITKKVSSTPNFNTESVLPGIIAVGHTDLEGDIRAMTGFIDAKEYGNTKPEEGEIGAVGQVRYILTNICEADTDAGGVKGTMVSTSGTSADVYSVIYFGADAWDRVAFKGAFAATPMILKPNVARHGDPAGQRGSVAFKTMIGTVILNDTHMAVVKCAATDL